MTLPNGGIPHLIDLALARGGHPSVRQLCLKIEIASSNVVAFRKGWYPPSDEVLFRLCKEAKEPFLPWAIYCHSLRNDGEIAEAWRAGLEQLELQTNKAAS